MTAPKKIRAVIFDWGGVCCSGGEPFALNAFREKIGMTPDEIEEATKYIHDDYYRGRFTRDEFWTKILDHFHLQADKIINPVSLSEAYLNSYALYPEVLAEVKKLRGACRVGLLSNLTPEMRDHIRRAHDVGQYFDAQVYSCDTGVHSVKPDSRIYEVIAERLGVPLDATLFIDDKEKNLQAGERMGMETLLFKTRGAFIDDLREFVKRFMLAR